MKKRYVSIIMAITMTALTACNASVAAQDPSSQNARGTSPETTDTQETGVKESGEKAGGENAGSTGSSSDESGFNSFGTPDSPVSDMKDTDSRVEMMGELYDGYTGRETVDSILLYNDYLLDSSIIRDMLENADGMSPNEREEAKSAYRDFAGHFRKISYYEPEEGMSIAICGGALYEYRTDDTDEIIKAYEMLPGLYPDEDYLYDMNVSGARGGLFSGISGAFKHLSPATNTMDAAIAEAPAAAAEEVMESEASMGDDMDAGAAEDIKAEEEYAYSEKTEDWNTEEYRSFQENRFMSADASPFSTFGMDVDTASYSNLRKKIFNDMNIPVDSVRTEEMLNYFDYDYSDPSGDDKFGVTVEISDTPWNEETRLLKVGVKSREADTEDIKSNVVFLIDTSGSMFDPDKLPLVQKSFLMLLSKLGKDDRVSLVTYAGNDEVKFKNLSCADREKVTDEIVNLKARGGTNGASGIRTAYYLAEKYFIKGGNNRVILATDGDLNLGITSESELVELIKKEKETGVFLSVLGVGQGNYKDSKMKALADNGNGNFAYIDSSSAADKALNKDFNSLMYTVAKDAKMQIEFNPAKIKGYRQIGYELRRLNAEDFADDTKDGAEIGSGQTVTVLYEVVPEGSPMEISSVKSKYSGNESGNPMTDELLTVSIRYKEPDADTSQLLEIPVTAESYRPEMSEDMSWAAGVAQTAMLLRDSEYKGASDYNDIYERLSGCASVSTDDQKAQFLYMVKKLSGGTFKVVEEDDGWYW